LIHWSLSESLVGIYTFRRPLAP